MNHVNDFKQAVTVASLLSSSCILACSSSAPRDVVNSNNSNQLDETSQAIVFEAHYSDSGLLQILSDEAGHLSMAVTGAIGKDDHVAIGNLVSPSFVETYQHLLPNTAVPHLLVELEARRTPITKPPATIERPATIEPPDQIPVVMSESDFLTNTCHNFSGHCSVQVVADCAYADNTTFRETTESICPAAGDWSLFWNDAATTGEHGLVYQGGSGFNVSAYTWGYHYWWAGYSCRLPYLWNVSGGNLGVTAHWRVPQPC